MSSTPGTQKTKRRTVGTRIFSFIEMLAGSEIPVAKPIAASLLAVLGWIRTQGYSKHAAATVRFGIVYPLIAPALGAALLLGIGYVSPTAQRMYARLIHAGFRLEDPAALALASDHSTLDYYQSINFDISPKQQSEPPHMLLLSRRQKVTFRVRETSMYSSMPGQCQSVATIDLDKPILAIFVGGQRVLQRPRSSDTVSISLTDSWWRQHEKAFESQAYRREEDRYDLPLEIKLTPDAIRMSGEQQCFNFRASVSIEVYKQKQPATQADGQV